MSPRLTVIETSLARSEQYSDDLLDTLGQTIVVLRDQRDLLREALLIEQGYGPGRLTATSHLIEQALALTSTVILPMPAPVQRRTLRIRMAHWVARHLVGPDLWNDATGNLDTWDRR